MCHKPGFPDEALVEVRPARQVRMDELDRHIPLQGKVVGLIDRPHAPFSQQAVYPVIAEGFAYKIHSFMELELLLEPGKLLLLSGQ